MSKVVKVHGIDETKAIFWIHFKLHGDDIIKFLLQKVWSLKPMLKSWGKFKNNLEFPDSSVGKESACNVGDPGSIPGSGRSPEKGVGYLEKG